MPETFDPPISVELDPETQKDFGTVEDVQRWLAAERDAFAWVSAFEKTIPGSPTPASSFMESRYAIIDKALNKYQRHRPDAPGLIPVVRQGVEQALRSACRGLLVSETRRGRHVASLLQWRAVAYIALCRFLGVSAEPGAASDEERRRGEAEAMFVDLRWTDVVDAYRRDLEQRANALQQSYAAAVEQFRGETGALVEQFRVAAEALADRLRDQVVERKSMAHAVTFWDKRSKEHEQAGGRWFVALIVAGVILIVAGFSFLPPLLEGPDWHRGAVVVAALVSLSFWLLRLFSKIAMSERHLARDARERIVQIETYLSLSESGKLPAEHQQIALHAIFRAAVTGLVDDGGAGGPVTPLEVITRVVERK